MHAVIGPNGAGKSTMFNVLSGVYRGLGRRGPLRRHRAHRAAAAPDRPAGRRPGLPEHRAVGHPDGRPRTCMLGRHALTKAGFLSSGLRLPRATREGAPARASASREIADVPRARRQAATRPVGVLSYGDQKRVEVARALCTEPAAAAARRAGGRHERRGDRADGRGRARDPRRARHLHRPGRARHGHGHEHRRPGHGPRLRTPDRRRHARPRSRPTPRSSAPTSAPATRSGSRRPTGRTGATPPRGGRAP